ncbi:hypothetical protein XaplCFBP3122_20050 [Xanthomonas arboricola pv. populi]|uniref:Uncharacterized protein n=1 Tax=Xanthomonas arboricola pv. populi TaxID=487823 RepID=A0A2S6YZD8_9XANT|nr:hypothetical protein XaplCFBP3122_20050 [Xanthomonas arboricola pv. populi]
MPPPTDALLAQMASVMHCERAEGFACVSARREHGAGTIRVPQRSPGIAQLSTAMPQIKTASPGSPS